LPDAARGPIHQDLIVRERLVGSRAVLRLGQQAAANALSNEQARTRKVGAASVNDCDILITGNFKELTIDSARSKVRSTANRRLKCKIVLQPLRIKTAKGNRSIRDWAIKEMVIRSRSKVE
jgi:hypothetical protein